ncbi:MAG: hypothetical protein AB8G96_08070 [Phycisphaerales bacterium]
MTLHPTAPRMARGLTLTEVSAGLATTAVLVGLTLPALAKTRNDGLTDVSLFNLRVLGTAHATYASDWNDRQPTHVPDDLSDWADSSAQASQGYGQFFVVNGNEALPGVNLGWGPLNGNGDFVEFRYRPFNNTANARLMEPIVFDGSTAATMQRRGSFLIPNSKQFRTYVAARFYDRAYYAPSDEVVSPLVEPLFDSAFEYVDRPPVKGFGDAPYWSSFIMSPAAMLDPAVLQAQVATRGGFKGGWVDPFQVAGGFESPTFSSVRYPGLKTLMLEHHWLQNAPDRPCNPNVKFGTYMGCEPYYFNHGIESAPATIFFDGSTRLLPNVEAVDADERIRAMNGGGDGTWSRTTPFGDDGYWSELALDGTQVSHHILTADGILGRDTLGPDKNPPDAATPDRRPSSASRSFLGLGTRAGTTNGQRTRPSSTADAPALLDNRSQDR